MKTTTVFTSGNSQAVRIPKEFQILGDRVSIERRGSSIILKPREDNNQWPEGYIESLIQDPADDSFTRHS